MSTAFAMGAVPVNEKGPNGALFIYLCVPPKEANSRGAHLVPKRCLFPISYQTARCDPFLLVIASSSHMSRSQILESEYQEDYQTIN